MEPNEMDGFAEPIFICYITNGTTKHKIMHENVLSK